jgi:hypothetical protein
MAAARRCLSSSCSRAICFLLPLDPRSPDLERRRRMPRLERRACCCWFLPASGMAASLSGGGGVPALGVRGRLDETMAIAWRELVGGGWLGKRSSQVRQGGRGEVRMGQSGYGGWAWGIASVECFERMCRATRDG